MFEKVQYNLEKCLTELYKYKKLGILNEDELKSVIETRKTYEYKIMRSQKVLLDFVEYIEYEKKLEKIVNKRNANAKTKLQYITKRILSICKLALRHFDNDAIVKMYMEYAMKKMQKNTVRNFVTSYMIQNPQNIDFVIFAANLYLQMDEIENAKMIFVKSLRLNKKEKKLYFELYKLELQNISNNREKNKEIGIRQDTDLTLCKNIIEQYKQNIDSDTQQFANITATNGMCEIVDHIFATKKQHSK